MPKANRGGRRAAAPQPAPQPVQQPAPQQQAAPVVANVPRNATPLTDQDASNLRQQQDSMYDGSTTAAVKMYISNTNFDKQGHSLSQAMNYALDAGIDLQNDDLATINRKLGTRFTANDVASMQYTDAYMQRGMHTIGRDVTLQRGAHDDLLKNAFGIQDYTRLTEAQLQARLVGQTFKTTSYMSTSYDVNKNPFLSSASGVSGGREVVYNVKAGASTMMLFGAKAQSRSC